MGGAHRGDEVAHVVRGHHVEPGDVEAVRAHPPSLPSPLIHRGVLGVGADGQNGRVLLARIVETSQAVAATRSRKAKVVALAEVLAEAGPDELEIVTAYLGGTLLQRRTGVGWRGIGSPPEPASEPTLTVTEVHETFDRIAALAGQGSQAARATAVADLLGRATADEQAWLRGVITGNVRQGALDALVQEAMAAASGAPLKAVRRAAMLAGGTVPVAAAAFEGEEALAAIGLEVGRPVMPMLASSAPDVTAAMTKAGGGAVAIDTKLDGIRIQVHRDGDDVVIATRSLDVITDRLPEVVEIARAAAGRAVRPRRRGAGARRGRPTPAVPGDRVPHRPGQRRQRDAVLLRPAPPRRHQPARPHRPSSAGRRWPAWCPRTTASPASSPPTPTRPPPSSPRRWPAATRAWS